MFWSHRVYLKRQPRSRDHRCGKCSHEHNTASNTRLATSLLVFLQETLPEANSLSELARTLSLTEYHARYITRSVARGTPSSRRFNYFHREERGGARGFLSAPPLWVPQVSLVRWRSSSSERARPLSVCRWRILHPKDVGSSS